MAEFAPGFRTSTRDACVLCAGAVGSGLLVQSNVSAAIVIGFAVAQFFLFCNVFRISRALELIWAGVFVVLAGATIVLGWPGWWVTAGISTGVTLVVILIEMRKPSYHGIGWRWINPDLPKWWEAQP